MSDTQYIRYTRQIMLSEIGTEGQERLHRSKVLVVGAGGLGSAVLPYLVGAGVGDITIIDPDVVSLSNLQRQVLYTEAELGMPKATVAARRLHLLNSQTHITGMPEPLTEANGPALVEKVDLVIDCTDNYAARVLIDKLCHQADKPWVHGAIGEFAGMVTVFNLPPHRRRYTQLFPDWEELCALPRKAGGVLGAVPGVVGTLEATEALKVLGHFGTPLTSRLLSINLLNMHTTLVDF